jgi:hypothetical protein
MRGIEHTAGYWFPWAINGSNFEQAELWDETTYYTAPNGSMSPSNSTASATPVVGPKTAWWLGLTLQEMAFAWWRVDRWRQKFVDTITLATPQASISADFSPADQLTFSRLTATTPLTFFRSDRRALIRAIRSVPGDYNEGLLKSGETPGSLMTVASNLSGGAHPAGTTSPGFSTSVGNPNSLVTSWETANSNFFTFFAGSAPDALSLDGAYRWPGGRVRYCPADGKYYVCMPTLSMRVRANSYGYPETRPVGVRIPVAMQDGVYRPAYSLGSGRLWAYGNIFYDVVGSDSVMGTSVLYAQTPPVSYGGIDAPSYMPGSSYFLPSQTTSEGTVSYVFAKGTEFEKTIAVPLFKRLLNVNGPRTFSTTSVIRIDNLGDYNWTNFINAGYVSDEAVDPNLEWGVYNPGGSLFSWLQLDLPTGQLPLGQSLPGTLVGSYELLPNWLDTIGNLDISIELSPQTYFGYGGVYNTATGAYIPPA